VMRAHVEHDDDPRALAALPLLRRCLLPRQCRCRDLARLRAYVAAPPRPWASGPSPSWGPRGSAQTASASPTSGRWQTTRFAAQLLGGSRGPRGPRGREIYSISWLQAMKLSTSNLAVTQGNSFPPGAIMLVGAVGPPCRSGAPLHAVLSLSTGPTTTPRESRQWCADTVLPGSPASAAAPSAHTGVASSGAGAAVGSTRAGMSSHGASAPSLVQPGSPVAASRSANHSHALTDTPYGVRSGSPGPITCWRNRPNSHPCSKPRVLPVDERVTERSSVHFLLAPRD